ncbi:MAG: hypothetical protein U0270_02385 [Labilithrix sp.]
MWRRTKAGLDNGKIVRLLARKYPEILSEFQRIVDARGGKDTGRSSRPSLNGV